jgi:hypothetical protein
MSSVITGIPLLISIGISSSLFPSGKEQTRRPLPPVSPLSWAENEVRFPARFAKNRTSSVVYGQFNAFTSSLLRFFLLCLLGNNKQGACWPALLCPIGHTSSEPSTDPQSLELVDSSRQTNFSL